jgi:hypothetical protein
MRIRELGTHSQRVLVGGDRVIHFSFCLKRDAMLLYEARRYIG